MNIVTVPHKVLTAPSETVKKIDGKILSITEGMKKILIETDNPRGVGLAAPQVGIGLRIFITRPTEKANIDVFINPEITWRSDEVSEIIRPNPDKKRARDDKRLEGCLSIPNVWGHLKRPKKVRLKYTDVSGREKEEEFEGFMATIIQHETDHTNGILFTQRVIEQNEKLYCIEEDEKGKEELVEIKI